MLLMVELNSAASVHLRKEKSGECYLQKVRVTFSQVEVM